MYHVNHRFGLVSSSSRKRTETVQVGHHTIAIFPTFEDEMLQCLWQWLTLRFPREKEPSEYSVTCLPFLSVGLHGFAKV
jgi:hypothetical protein